MGNLSAIKSFNLVTLLPAIVVATCNNPPDAVSREEYLNSLHQDLGQLGGSITEKQRVVQNFYVGYDCGAVGRPDLVTSPPLAVSRSSNAEAAPCVGVKWWKYDPDCDCNATRNTLCREDGTAVPKEERAIDSTVSCITLAYFEGLECGTVDEEEIEEICGFRDDYPNSAAPDFINDSGNGEEKINNGSNVVDNNEEEETALVSPEAPPALNLT